MQTIYFEGLEYKEVRSETGRIWLDRNLGAKMVSENGNNPKSFGDLYYADKIKYPKGYRLPNDYEWMEEVDNLDKLKIPNTGVGGIQGHWDIYMLIFRTYWSFSFLHEKPMPIQFRSENIGLGDKELQVCLPVRLIKDQ